MSTGGGFKILTNKYIPLKAYLNKGANKIIMAQIIPPDIRFDYNKNENEPQ